ncbi:ATP-binding protein [Streptomyces sp. NPDC015127]|uniref:ATP-binding protein n=1 Tax=Streptomyces sp. NPDC015127 TaxID=3364939 RepID=UPI0036F9F2B8
MSHEACMPRPAWELPFLAEPEEVAALRSIVRTHLVVWGLPEQIEIVQSCMSELVANVINHVGHGTPTTLAMSMRDTYLRIEVHDPDTRALPTLLQAAPNSESGRGMLLVDSLSDRWGVQLRADRKVTWCEIDTHLSAPNGHYSSARVTRAEAVISLFGAAKLPWSRHASRLGLAAMEQSAIDVIADILHWLRAHGCDPETVLDRAQIHFEAEVS